MRARLRPVARRLRWRRYTGEELFNAAEVEPHIALALAERLLRLSLADELVGSTAVSLGEGPEYKGEPTPTPPPPPPPPPRPMWNGPPRRAIGGGRPASGAPAVAAIRG
jgi:hypothetical protein